VRDAVRAMREGLFDYLTKPFASLDELTAVVDRGLAMDRAYRAIDDLREAPQTAPVQPVIIARSPAMQRLMQQARQIARLDTTVLIEGETGTGKELLARHIHALGPHADGPFLGLACGTLSEALLEATLFGYEKPAFSSSAHGTPGYCEEAAGGTLVLDDVDELSPKLQASLLRVLQERTFVRLGSVTQRASDFRLICTASTPLEDAVAAGRFRADLCYRINVNLLRLPPLRKRREDILPLALLFLEQFNTKFGKSAGPLAPDALAALEEAHWRGNVRELQHAIERATAVNVRGPIVAADLGLDGRARESGAGADLALSLQEARDIFDRGYFVDLLHSVGGNVSKAAKSAGISRQALYRYLRYLGIVTRN
jgi:two-component system response regulator HydG